MICKKNTFHATCRTWSYSNRCLSGFQVTCKACWDEKYLASKPPSIKTSWKMCFIGIYSHDSGQPSCLWYKYLKYFGEGSFSLQNLKFSAAENCGLDYFKRIFCHANRTARSHEPICIHLLNLKLVHKRMHLNESQAKIGINRNCVA